MSNELYRGVVVVRTITNLIDSNTGSILARDVPMNRYYYTKAYDKIGVARGRLTVRRKEFKPQDVVEWYTEKVSAWERVDD